MVKDEDGVCVCASSDVNPVFVLKLISMAIPLERLRSSN